MRTAYRVFAYLIAAAVVVQAAAIAYAIAGLEHWVDDGGVLDKAAVDSDVEFTGVAGFIIHGINGTMVIPLLALIFLIVSFFAKVPGGVMLAAVTLGLVVLQIALGLMGHDAPIFGLLHGINALILFSVAVMAGMRAKSVAPSGERVAA